ncbi:MAG: SLBB domain-containing protein [bacterium]|nr:SLBB domain-containing protein [bacterium]
MSLLPRSLHIRATAFLVVFSALTCLAQVNRFTQPRSLHRGPTSYDTTGRERVEQLSAESSGLLEREIDPATYVLGPNDVLTISVWASDSEHFDCIVTPEGKLTIPRAGVVSVKGMTLDSARNVILKQISRVYRSANADVSLKRLRQFKVYVLGAVRLPSVVTATAADHVFDVLERAGGIIDTGSVRAITLVREGVTAPIKVDLQPYLAYGDRKSNPTVLGGDRIIVPLRNSKNTIEIAGEIAVEGHFDFRETDSLSTLVRMAGGFLPSARLDSVSVVRVSESGSDLQVLTLDLESWRDKIHVGVELEHDMLLRAGDRVYVRAIPKWKQRASIVVAGEVQYPGRYPITPQQTRLTELIRDCGGFTNKASLEDAVIIRVSELLLKDKEFDRLSQVPVSDMSTNELQYYKTKAREVKGVLSVDFTQLFLKNNLENNPVLQDGDSIYVPSKNLYVNVTGSVRNPGRIVYKPGLPVGGYISLAGGYGFRADPSATLIVKVKGDQFPASSDDYSIEPGDNIVVLDEPEGSFGETFTKALTIFTQLVTVFGVVYTIVRLK